MLDHRRFLFSLTGLLALLVPAVSSAQIYSDGDFLETGYTSSTSLSSSNLNWPGNIDPNDPNSGFIPGQSDIRYNVDYSNLDVFGDGFVVIGLPEAPRSDPNDTDTTGIFLSANNDSFDVGANTWSMAAATPIGLNVGTGTANPNFKMTVDVFHSTGTGVYDAAGDFGGLSGTTNLTHIGINQTNTTVQVEDINAPEDGGNLTGQGLGLMMTGDGGAVDDYIPIYGGAIYRDNAATSTPGVSWRGVPDPNDYSGTASGRSGLAANIINRYWLDQGLGFGMNDIQDPTYDPNNPLLLAATTSSDTMFTPDPNKISEYDINDPNGQLVNQIIRNYGEPLTETTGTPTHLSGTFIENTDPNAPDVGDNDFFGVISNRWVTHELYWIDGVFTYVMDGVPLLEIDPDHDPNDISQGNVYDDYSESGSVVLGFFDRFNSVADSPEGGNFVIYDNLTVEAATAGDAPGVLDYYGDLGFLLPNDSADVNGDGIVDGLDFLQIQREDPSLIPLWESQYGTSPVSAATAAVPEPLSSSLMLMACGCLAACRRRR